MIGHDKLDSWVQDDLRQADISLRLKESCKKFTSHAKNTILGSIMSADRTTQIRTHSRNKINYLVWGVRRELTLRGEIEDALEWWNQMSSDIFSMLNNSNDQALHRHKLDATSKNILTARSTLQSNLSVMYIIQISLEHTQHKSYGKIAIVSTNSSRTAVLDS